MNFFGGGAVLLVLTPLVSFRFSIQGILTTDPSPRAKGPFIFYEVGGGAGGIF